MAAVEQTVILLSLKRGRKVKEVQGSCEVFQRIMQVSCGLGILTYYQVIELAGHFMLKDGVYQKGGAAALEVPAMNALGLGQYESVRQLKKAGRMQKRPG
jgi:hypothetical protein